MATIAYRYRIRRVLSDEKRVIDEIRAGHRLYNDLVAIERERREETRAHWADVGGYAHLVSELEPATEAAVAAAKLLPKGERKSAWEAVDALRKQVWELERATIEAHSDPSKVRRKARAKELMTAAKERGEKLTAKDVASILDREPDCVSPRDAMRLQIQAEYEARGVAVSAKAMAQRLRDAGLGGQTEHIEAKAREAAYAAYQARGVSPGTRAVVTEAHDRSLAMLVGADQHFKRWDGRGSFGVQIQGGMSVGELHDEHAQLRIKCLPDEGHVREGSRRSGRNYLLRVRIGSEGNRKLPVWADFALILDRPMHVDAKITQAIVTVDRVGLHDQWHVVMTANVPDEAYGAAPAEQLGKVAVDVGWRSHKGDLRVGYWADNRGGSGELCVPPMRGPKGPITMREKLAHADDLKGLQSRLFLTGDNAMEASGILADVARWLDANKETLPEWLVLEAKTLSRWRSHDRLNWLAEKWLRERFDGDAEIVLKLDAWRKTWRHLHEWECREREHVLAARKEHYRLIAARLARSYRVIVLNGVDLARTRKRKPKETAQELVMVEDLKRSQAFDAAPGELRAEIERAAKKYGVTVVKQAFDTETCHACGAMCVFDRVRKVVHECEHCGHRWDQDLNACRNALRERSGDEQTMGGACKRRKGCSVPLKLRESTPAREGRGKAAQRL